LRLKKRWFRYQENGPDRSCCVRQQPERAHYPIALVAEAAVSSADLKILCGFFFWPILSVKHFGVLEF